MRATVRRTDICVQGDMVQKRQLCTIEHLKKNVENVINLIGFQRVINFLTYHLITGFAVDSTALVKRGSQQKDNGFKTQDRLVRYHHSSIYRMR
jgi:hypothetical protein